MRRICGAVRATVSEIDITHDYNQHGHKQQSKTAK